MVAVAMMATEVTVPSRLCLDGRPLYTGSWHTDRQEVDVNGFVRDVSVEMEESSKGSESIEFEW